jgi:hypothetical protein
MQFPFMLINNVPLGHDHDCIQSRAHTMSAHRGIVLQKSKVAPARSFGETLKHEAIDDSDNLSRATEVAYEFSV